MAVRRWDLAAVRMRTVLEPGEVIQGTWIAGLPTRGDRGIKYGGRLFLTSRRLVWEPLDLPGLLKAAPGLRMLDGLCRGLPLNGIVAVRPDPDHRALLQIDGPDGSLRLLVGASLLTPVWSRQNRAARDAAATAIQAALSARPA